MKHSNSIFWLIVHDFSYGVVFFFIFLILFIGGKGLANPTDCSDPANGGVRCGAFLPWFHSAMVDQNISLNGQITSPAKYTSHLVGEDGNRTFIVSAKDGKTGVNTENPTEMLDIVGDKPVLNLYGTQGSFPKLQMKGLGTGAPAFISLGKEATSSRNTWIAHNDQSQMIFDSSGGVNFSNHLKINSTYVVQSGVSCPKGRYVSSINTNGVIVCTPFH
ncbi:MAG: hypothetical protein WCJ84_06490 [Candidatus Peregrinibacteria bacterium]